MRIDVALLPGQAVERAGAVCVVVDVLRASSSIVTLLERGASCVVTAADIAAARRLHSRLAGHLLCGEKDGLPPEGFAYGNSPAEFWRAELGGAPVILATSNGTRLLAAVAEEAPAVLVGCLLNRSAVARAAISIALERGLDVLVACSGAYQGSVFVLEDALGAGAIVDAALALDPALAAGDAARFARDAFVTARPRLREAVASAYHAAELVEAGLGDDVEFCSRLDVSGVAPVLGVGEDGVLRLVAWGQSD
jgi:2-phosphosulfolactate phosphatase